MQNEANCHDVMLCYRKLIEQGEIYDDPAQRLVVEKLNLLAQRLKRPNSSKGFANALFGWGRESIHKGELLGLYIYGSVGRGKSMLMQLFVDVVGAQTDRIYRVHFHEFMQNIHKELAGLRKLNTADPIAHIAKKFATRYRVLCLDEMQIENIADAMIVARLFEVIFSEGVVLVTTSNRHPDALYKGGLNRDRFMPFVELLQARCEVIDLAGEHDYRTVGMKEEQRFFIGWDANALDQIWAKLAPMEEPFDLQLAGRVWQLPRYNNRVTRLDFAEICERARGASDYQALVEMVEVLVIDNIPILDREKTSAVSRFITLIDILYESKTQLYLSLARPLDKIHNDPATAFVFERTRSRLNEMSQTRWGNAIQR